MNKTHPIQPYKHEDDLVSIRIGKPGDGEGAFLAFDGNVQFGIADSEYTTTLIPLLEAIVEESSGGEFRFYKRQDEEYCLQCHGLIIVVSIQTGAALQDHAQSILNHTELLPGTEETRLDLIF